MRRRSGLEIVAQMLIFCKEPQIKTRVMYGLNLSWGMVEKYLSLLQSSALLEVHHSPTKYLTTQKGLKFLRSWEELTKLV
jgi:predicted transcriptional regulator